MPSGPPRPASKGSQKVVSASGNRNDAGITPTMGEHTVAEAQRAADDARVTAETGQPRRVADDRVPTRFVAEIHGKGLGGAANRAVSPPDEPQHSQKVG